MLECLTKHLTHRSGVSGASSYEAAKVGVSASKIALALASALFLLSGCGGGGGGSDGSGASGKSYNVAAVSAGEGFSLALASDGTVWVTGKNDVGQIGFGGTAADPTNDLKAFTKLQFFDNKDIVAIAAGRHHSLVLSSDGRVYASGENGNGQLGLGNTADAYTFTEVSSLAGKKIVAVSAGQAHSLAIDSDGALYVAGDNSYGRTGLGTTSGNTQAFTKISTLDGKKIVAISAGQAHSLAVDNNGKVYGTGHEIDGRVGLGGPTRYINSCQCATTFTEVEFPEGVKIAKVAGGYDYSYAIADNGDLYITGDRSDGVFGDGNTLTGIGYVSRFTKLEGVVALAGKKIVAAAPSEKHALILTDDDKVYVTGDRGNGRTGEGTLLNSLVGQLYTFTELTYLTDKNVTAIATGHAHSLVISDENVIHATGENENGQLGFANNIILNLVYSYIGAFREVVKLL